jgi:putative hemolysin
VGGIIFLLVLLLIVLNGVFALSELAIVSSRKTRLRQRLDAGQRGAAAALELSEDPNRFLSAVQIGITLIGVGTGALGGAALAGPVGDLLAHIPGFGRWAHEVAGLVVVVVLTYLSLIIGELVPKRLALQNPEGMACAVAPSMRILAKITSPVVTFLSKSSDFVFRILGVGAPADDVVSEEEIRLLIKQGTEAGVFLESERSMVSGVFEVADRTVGELMTPRHLITFLDLAQPDAENQRRMAETPHNFYPVCDGSTDNVVGVVATRELWRRHLTGQPTSIEEAREPALFVPEVAPVLAVVDQMRQQRSPMAIVVDEYGGIEGLITFNDVLSDVVGEIDDPGGTGLRGAVGRADGSWLLDGVFPAHEAIDLLDLDALPGEAESRFETIGGFILDQLGEIPHEGDHVTHGGYRFEVVDMDGNRVDKVLVMPESSMPANDQVPDD